MKAVAIEWEKRCEADRVARRSAEGYLGGAVDSFGEAKGVKEQCVVRRV